MGRLLKDCQDSVRLLVTACDRNPTSAHLAKNLERSQRILAAVLMIAGKGQEVPDELK